MMSTELKVSMSIPNSIEETIFVLKFSLEVVLCLGVTAAEAVAVLCLHKVVKPYADAVVAGC